MLLGGGSGLIGDLSGKDQECPMRSQQQVATNVAALREQVVFFFARTDGPALVIVNNAGWYGKMDIIRFLSDVGKHFSFNQMLTHGSVRMWIERKEQDISFTEFTYQLIRAYDFLYLSESHGC